LTSRTWPPTGIPRDTPISTQTDVLRIIEGELKGKKDVRLEADTTKRPANVADLTEEGGQVQPRVAASRTLPEGDDEP
jgi:hypothetical protein